MDWTNILVNSLIIIGFVTINLCIIVLYRNDKVLDFRLKVLDMAYQKATYMMDHDMDINYKDFLHEYLGSISYERMLFSFKKLKLESFYTEDQIRKLEVPGSK